MNISTQLIDKYNIPVPRYTSYPPANFFHDEISQQDYVTGIKDSNQDDPQLISFYIHIPFCHKICHFCGCNAMKPPKKSIIEEYMDALKKEIQMMTALIDKRRKVSQIHYGGGTPNAIEASYLKEINQMLFDQFDFIDDAEIAIECNPAHLDYAYIDQLFEAGFNRFSIGIQDFDPEILKTINRDPSHLPVVDLANYIRSKSDKASVNLDFIYGLPGQTIDSFNQSIKQAISIKPDRLVTFSYAHVPWVKKHQQILERKGLPTATDKLSMFLSSRQLLLDAGYEAIGLDHYVLPNDELFISLNNHQLHRNFQGYCTRRTTGQVYAFGVSAISQLENIYIQNVKDIAAYIELVESGKLPTEKGYQVSENQKIIREVITEIMCNNYLDLNTFAKRFGITVNELKQITDFSVSKIQNLMDDGILTYKDDVLTVFEHGSFFIRNIAAAFDPNYELENNKYSKSV